ncbi:hypothetical protein [Methylobacterium gregans]|uniref:hypothetical protein n=1 Tax=Methylobacterium gregans TaxID=374424 RepID=UPI0036139D53
MPVGESEATRDVVEVGRAAEAGVQAGGRLSRLQDVLRLELVHVLQDVTQDDVAFAVALGDAGLRRHDDGAFFSLEREDAGVDAVDALVADGVDGVGGDDVSRHRAQHGRPQPEAGWDGYVYSHGRVASGQ